MGGSLRLTAGYCNVIGLRPSAGRVPVYPAADGYAGLSVQGPMARTVDDVALLLSVMAGPDRRSPISLEEPARRSPTSPPAVWPDAGSPFHRPRRPDRDRDEIAGMVGSAAAVCETAARRSRMPAPISAAPTSVSGLCGPGSSRPPWVPGRALRAGQGEPVREHAAGSDIDRPAGRAGCGTAPSAGPADAGVPGVLRRADPAGGAGARLRRGIQYPDVVAGRQQPDYLGRMGAVCHATVTGHSAISMPAGFTAAGTPLGCSSSDGTAGSATSLAWPGFESVTTCASIHPHLS